MNRNLLLALVLIVIGGVGIYWFLFRPSRLPSDFSQPLASTTPSGAPTAERAVTLPEILAAIKEKGGFTWEASPKQVNGLKNGEELVLMGMGFGYGEDLGSSLIDQKYQALEALFLEKGFSLEAGTDGKMYQRGNLVCNLIRREVVEKGSSEIEVGCAQLD